MCVRACVLWGAQRNEGKVPRLCPATLLTHKKRTQDEDSDDEDEDEERKKEEEAAAAAGKSFVMSRKLLRGFLENFNYNTAHVEGLFQAASMRYLMYCCGET